MMEFLHIFVLEKNIIKMKNPKYLVRPDDFHIFEIDPLNGCYRGYEEKKVKNRFHAYDHFTFENLTENYGWFPITKEEIPKYLEKMHFHYAFLSWQCRNDGHGEAKGGTLGEYIEYLERVKRWQLLKEKENDKNKIN
jgi:hypothetical protein